MPTPDIFDFDAERLEHYDAHRAAEALETHPAIYVNHLQVAQHIDAAATAMESHAASDDSDRPEGDRRYDEGYVAALRTVVAYLRQGDYTPTGAILYEPEPTRRFKAR